MIISEALILNGFCVNIIYRIAAYDRENLDIIVKNIRRPAMNDNSYVFPTLELLSEFYDQENSVSHDDNPQKIVSFFKENDIEVELTDVFEGPLVTEYAITIPQGVHVRRVTGLREDLMTYLAYPYINIEFPVLGQSKIGIDVPSDQRYILPLRTVLDSKSFVQTKKSAAFVIGKNLQNQTIMGDLAEWPHMIIGGTTGSGKSCYVDSIIIGMIYKYSPDELQFIMLDSTGTNFSVYDALPHMAVPTIRDINLSFQIFGWLKKKMKKRFKEFAKYNVRTIQSYNERVSANGGRKLPSIVVVIDDLRDFIQQAPKKTKIDISEIVLAARAAGIYLIVVTQNPQKEVLATEIKANLCGRFAFRVNSFHESKNIIEVGGAEKLLGTGECRFDHPGRHNLGYAQTPYVSNEDIRRVVAFVSKENKGKFQSDVDMDEVANEVTGALF